MSSGPIGSGAGEAAEAARPADVQRAVAEPAPAARDVVGVAHHRGALHLAQAAVVEPQRRAAAVLGGAEQVRLGVEGEVRDAPGLVAAAGVLAGEQLGRVGAAVEGAERVAHLLGAVVVPAR